MEEKKDEKDSQNNIDKKNNDIKQDEEKQKNENIIQTEPQKNNHDSNKRNNFDDIINHTEIENREIILNKRLKEIEDYIKNIKYPEEYINSINKNNDKGLYNKNNESIKNKNNIKSNPKKINSAKKNYVNYYRNKVKSKVLKSENLKPSNKLDFESFQTLKNEKRKKVFNRITDNNKRNYSFRDNKSKLNKEFISVDKLNKKYNNSEWNEIYNKRFKSYQEKINEKREESRKKIEENKKKKEDEIINLCPKRKASMDHIMETSQKMHDEAKKRKIKIEEKKMNSKNVNDMDDSENNFIFNKPYIFESEKNFNSRYNKYNLFLNKKGNNYNNIKVKNRTIKNKKDIKKNNRFPVSEFNNKRFDRKFRGINNSMQSEKYIFKNNYEDVDDGKYFNKNILYFEGKSYNLEEERKILTQMAKHKNLYEINDNYNLDYELKGKNNGNKKNNLESDKLIYEFFMRQLES